MNYLPHPAIGSSPAWPSASTAWLDQLEVLGPGRARSALAPAGCTASTAACTPWATRVSAGAGTCGPRCWPAAARARGGEPPLRGGAVGPRAHTVRPSRDHDARQARLHSGPARAPQPDTRPAARRGLRARRPPRHVGYAHARGPRRRARSPSPGARLPPCRGAAPPRRRGAARAPRRAPRAAGAGVARGAREARRGRPRRHALGAQGALPGARGARRPAAPARQRPRRPLRGGLPVAQGAGRGRDRRRRGARHSDRLGGRPRARRSAHRGRLPRLALHLAAWSTSRARLPTRCENCSARHS